MPTSCFRPSSARLHFEFSRDPALQVHTTEFNLLEVERYLPRLSAKYELSEYEMRLQLRLLPVDVHAADSYFKHFDWATELLKTRDADDAHPLALACLLDLPRWSNDRDLQIRWMLYDSESAGTARTASERII